LHVSFVGLPEVLILAVAAGGITVVGGDAVPEKAGGKAVARVSRAGKTCQRAHQFWNLGVGVQAGEPVLMALERIEHGVVLETVG
jgi:hypothetical protein